MIFGSSLFSIVEKNDEDDIEIRTKKFYLKAITDLLDREFGDYIRDQCREYLKTEDVEHLKNVENKLFSYVSNSQYPNLIKKLAITVSSIYEKVPFQIGGLGFKIKNKQKTVCIVMTILRDYLTDNIIPSIRGKKVDEKLTKVISRKYFEVYKEIDCFIFHIDLKLCEFIEQNKWLVKDILKIMFNDENKVRNILQSYNIGDLKSFREIRKHTRFY